MATDKPLPAADDDIIDLTDLVEEGAGDAKASADEGPVDMSFEQELEDLFGDVDPAPAKAPAGKAAAPADDDLMDLSGLGLDDDADTPAPAAKADAPADDDIMDLAGLGLDDDADTPAPAAKADAPSADEDDIMDLAGLELDGGAETPAAADDDIMDLAGLEVDDAAGQTAAPASPDAASQTGADDLFELPDLEADDSAPGAGDLGELGDLDFAGLGQDATAAAPEAAVQPGEADLDNLDFLTDVGEATPEPADAAAMDDDALAEALGTPPGDEDVDIAELSGIAPLEEAPTPPAAEAHATADAPPVPGSAAGAATLAAMGASATAAGAARVGDIDLGALDTLIDAAKGPPPEPEPEGDADQGRLDALADRLDAVESATAALLDKFEALPPATDGDALADALSARLEDALSERLEAVLAGLPQAPDMAAVRADVQADLDARAAKEREGLLAELSATLDTRLDALTETLRRDDADAPWGTALGELGQTLTRLEQQADSREAAFKDFATGMETRLAELRRELPDPAEFATAASLDARLEDLRETLARDIAGNLDERLGELRRELRETLAGDIAASLDDRLKGVTEQARQAAREEARPLAEALAGRIEALEADRVDPEALTETVRDTLRRELGDELTQSLETAVPKAAATVIREEISALLKEFS